ncbi:N-acetylglucosamine-6-phosphate deacetylase [Allobaculum mucilyticum]|uniref:N-acetylglucosamine-6-phosphate deacetylase n=1 Tax=Allobaculum mucilyticum TaxID=2834459 RepID=UPI001E2B846E|nr:N-acetylglucosamine-6-phosphate deacetylase [Allobaculum mucilyticum]UNT96794.1 N-acetylglucosamine-6-phosphate deacetylase [Allobaculum mucilyticum]
MIIQSRKVWVVDTWMPCQIKTEGDKIAAILPYGTLPADEDYGDLRIVPGFIDQHTHGAYGWDTNDATEEGLRNWMKNITKEGVTGILPTTITQSEEVLTNAVKNVAKVVREGYEGAEILGIHFEGPYLDQVYKGAQPEQFCVKPDLEQFKRYWEASDHLIKVITMATEHDCDYELTHFCVDHGIVVSQGHSSATYEQALMGVANGAMSMTHVYNGMTKFHHREPGLVGAAFRFKDVYGEIICDGNHSTHEALYDFYSAKGPNFAVMITDSLMVKSLPTGTKVLFGGNEIELMPDGSAHLTSTGGLAGSTLKVNEGLKVLEDAGIPWLSAINSATINPATLLGVNDRKGSIQAGKDADLVVLNPDYSVVMTYTKGKKAF